MKTIAIMNQKGGSGKTTTTVNLGACLATKKRSVLLVDLDPQAQTTNHLGFISDDLDITLTDVLSNNCSATDAMLPTEIDGLFVLPSHISLTSVEIALAGEISRETILKQCLNGLDFDVILIDCPPSLGLLTLNGLNAAQGVFVPIQTEYFAMEGLSKLLQTVEVIKDRLNPALEVSKIVLTLYDARKRLCKDVAEKIEEYFPKRVFKTRIRDNVRLAEAPSSGQPITLYSPKSYGAQDYKALAREVLRWLKGA